MYAQPESTVGPGDHAVAADNAGVTNQPIGDHLRVLDDVRRVADDAGNQNPVVDRKSVV